MKAIFLDVDGVLNSNDGCRKWYRSHKRSERWSQLEPEKIKLILDLVKRTGAKIILSSTWRLNPDRIKLLECNNLKIDDTTSLSRCKLVSDPRLIKNCYSMCGNSDDCADRGLFILDYLEEHPEITEYVSIDDDNHADVENWIGPNHCVTPSWLHGLTKDQAERAYKLLMGEKVKSPLFPRKHRWHRNKNKTKLRATRNNITKR